jgi:DNA repair protein RadC
MDNLHDGHRQRLRDRFLKEGLGGFTAHNALELLLFYSIPRADTNETAHRLLKTFGSLSGIFEADYRELARVEGVGFASAALLKLIPALCRMYMEDKVAEGVALDTPQQIYDYMAPKYIGETNEVVYVLCLDRRRKLLLCQRLIEGTLDSAPIILRHVVEIAVRSGASSLVLVHNHPQGFPIPSSGDIKVTIKLKESLDLLGIQLADHMIIARDSFASLADMGVFLNIE